MKALWESIKLCREGIIGFGCLAGLGYLMFVIGGALL